jgi:DNA-binding transcriptional ArsR family regulator
MARSNGGHNGSGKHATSRAELILHPVRMRLIVALARRQRTARQLGEILADVPQATLYHHLGLLTKGGVLRVVEEHPVRGTIEKVYALASDQFLSPEDMAAATPDDHLRYFTAFVTGLLADFGRYLQSGPMDMVRDGVGYHQLVLHLADEELMRMAQALNAALLPFLRNGPAPNRRRRLFSTVLMPDVAPPGANADAPAGRGPAEPAE